MSEYLLPGSGNPVQLFVAEDGTVWFVDQIQVRHLDPATGSLMSYSKDGVVPEALTPIPRHDRSARLLGLADQAPFIDILCAPPVEEVFVPSRQTPASETVTTVTPAPSRPILSTVELVPQVTGVQPVDPPLFARYATETPTLAVGEHRDALFATGANFLESVFRFYQIPLCTALVGSRDGPSSRVLARPAGVVHARTP